MDFDSVFYQKVGSISAGSKRILSLGLALLNKPKVLILDEPSANFDLISRQKVWNAIVKIKKKVSFIIAT